MSRTDQATVDYFDRHCHEYGRERIKGVAKVLRPLIGPDARLVDVGAGTGGNLARLSRALGIDDITALDVSAESLERVRKRLPQADVACVSVLEPAQMQPLAGQFDVVLMAAVLHHLVGPTRSASRRCALEGLRNAASLARPGGLVVVLEPVFTPRGVLGHVADPSGALFWTKRAVTLVTSERVPVLGYWNNIGAPVVSFYSFREVSNMVARAGLEPLMRDEREQPLGAFDAVVSRGDATYIARVPGGPDPETRPRGSQRPRRGGRSRRQPQRPEA